MWNYVCVFIFAPQLDIEVYHNFLGGFTILWINHDTSLLHLLLLAKSCSLLSDFIVLSLVNPAWSTFQRCGGCQLWVVVLRVSKFLIYLFNIILEVVGLSVLFGTTTLWMLHLIFAFILSFYAIMEGVFTVFLGVPLQKFKRKIIIRRPLNE